jgi:hypothetical protein
MVDIPSAEDKFFVKAIISEQQFADDDHTI